MAHPAVRRSPVAVALDRIVSSMPGGGEVRPGQDQMAEATAAAIARRRHLIVQAQTGTGKSLAYLVPAIVSGSRVVVATATKALQDQLAGKDLPLVAAALGHPIEFALLKGRSNYLCRQRAVEVAGAGDQLSLDATAAGPAAGPPLPPTDGVQLGRLGREIRNILEWGATSETGDRADLPFEPSPQAWAQVSVGVNECPGAGRCPSGERCFAEAARKRAGLADVIVVNTHLYATHLSSGRGVLPDHDVVIFDEAHELEDVASSSFGLEITARRFIALARTCRPLLENPELTEAVEEAGTRLGEALAPFVGQRLPTRLDTELTAALTLGRDRVARLSSALRGSEGDPARKARGQQSATHLTNDLDQVLDLPSSHVGWVEGPGHALALKVAPVDIGATLARLLWDHEDAPTVVLTSATIPVSLADRIGLSPGSFDQLDVASPFDYGEQGLLYCAAHLPDPRHHSYEAAMVDELVALITAAGGRTLALFTSWRAVEAAVTAVRARIPWPILTQSDLPKPALIARFQQEEHSCLFATMSFWQGVDVPGPALSMVTIDRIPFPRPDEPLLQARRERLGPAAFRLVDLPRAATLLAQGAGRLIRSSTDRGVVAILDPRLAHARYRWDLVRALPPLRRTRHRSEVEAFLAPLRQRGGS